MTQDMKGTVISKMPRSEEGHQCKVKVIPNLETYCIVIKLQPKAAFINSPHKFPPAVLIISIFYAPSIISSTVFFFYAYFA